MFKAYFFQNYHAGVACDDHDALEWEPCFHFPGEAAQYFFGV